MCGNGLQVEGGMATRVPYTAPDVRRMTAALQSAVPGHRYINAMTAPRVALDDKAHQGW